MKIKPLNESLISKILTIVLAIAIISAVVAIGYTIATPRTHASFTEFYLLETGAATQDYPKKMLVGQEDKVTLKIANHEKQTIDYWIETRIADVSQGKLGPITLMNGEASEKTVSFSLSKAGDNQKVEFLLYKNNEPQSYLSLYIWVNVT